MNDETATSPEEPMETDTLLNSIPQAGRRTGLSRTTLYRLMSEGQLEYVNIGTRRLIPEDALQSLVAANRTTGCR
jgi:excisionase family DNA binding protein